MDNIFFDLMHALEFIFKWLGKIAWIITVIILFPIWIIPYTLRKFGNGRKRI